MADGHTDKHVHGSCLCGAVQFDVARFSRDMTYCHCTQCRKQTGHYTAAVNVKLTDIEISGKGALTWFAASDAAKRGFCATCGSALFWQPNDKDYLSVMGGSLDSPTGLTPIAHIYVADKGDYYTLDDGLPQYEQYD